MSTLRRRLTTARGTGEAATSLVEVMVALLMLSLVSTSAAVLFVNSLRTSTEQSTTQRAIAVATRALETAQAMPVTELVTGRRQADVVKLNSSLGPLVAGDVVTADYDPATRSGNYDPAAGPADVAILPLTGTEKLDGTTYRVATAINRCWLTQKPAKAGPGGTNSCTRTETTGARLVYRSTVNVTWGEAGCARCSYSTSALLDQRADPLFKVAQSVPLIQVVTPGSSARTTTKAITITGAEFSRLANVSLDAAGGSLTSINVIDSNTITADWTAGTAEGAYVLSVTNPDGGRAQYSVTVTAAVAVDDCVATRTDTGGNPRFVLYADVRSNDDPVDGAITVLSGPVVLVDQANKQVPNGDPTGRYLRFESNANGGQQTATYRISAVSSTSSAATVTFRLSGSCS